MPVQRSFCAELRDQIRHRRHWVGVFADSIGEAEEMIDQFCFDYSETRISDVGATSVMQPGEVFWINDQGDVSVRNETATQRENEASPADGVQ